jgi:myo-inositol-1(or 4)-monophosphatase
MTFSERHRTALTASQLGAETLRTHFARLGTLAFETKQDKSLVSEADRDSESKIMALIHGRHPDDSTFGEESGRRGGTSGQTWFVDPLDGTSNFAMGMSHFATSVGVVQGNVASIGAVVAPLSGLVAHAEAGQGAFLNDAKLTVKDAERQSLLVALDVPYGGDALGRKVEAELARCARRVMSFWCPSFDYVALAASRLDAIVCLGAEIEDKVAGLCIAQAAGARVVGLNQRFEAVPLALDASADYAPWFVAAASDRVLDLILASLSRSNHE